MSSESCEHEMEVLHQYSGQCWNDASIIFLWFASGAGVFIQERLQDPKIIEYFEEWLADSRTKQNILSVFPDAEKNYMAFSYYFVEYMKCMKQRYDLWKQVEGPKKIKTTLQRRMSCSLSRCGEDYGIKTSELLVQDTIYRPRTEKLSNRESVIEGSGYNTTKFNNVLFLMLHFFLNGNIALLSYQKEDTPKYGEYLKTLSKPVFLHNPFDPRFFSSFYELHTFQPIFKNVSNHYRLSMIVGLKALDSPSLHAVTFLTCQDGSEYFYDDNLFVLAKMKWKLLFKDLLLDKVCILYKSVHKGGPIMGIDLPEASPLFIAFSTMDNGDLFVLYPETNYLLYFENVIKNDTDLQHLTTTMTKEELDSGVSSRAVAESYFSGDKNTYTVYSINSLLFDPFPTSPKETSYKNLQILGKKKTNFDLMKTKLSTPSERGNPFVGQSIETKENMKKNEQLLLDELFFKAAGKGNKAEVERLLNKGADIHAYEDGALISAVIYNHSDVVKYLVENGANIHAQNDQAIVSAVRNKDIVLTDYLFNKGANIEAQDGALLKDSIINNYGDMVKYLISKGIDIHRNNDAALFIAVSRKNIFITKLLLNAGIDVQTQNNKAMAIAIQNKDIPMIKFLASKGANKELVKQSKNLSLRFIYPLLQGGKQQTRKKGVLKKMIKGKSRKH